ncbi:MAG: hypothetical protein ACJ74Q_10180 [Pyrinomonadaceae bacterium]
MRRALSEMREGLWTRKTIAVALAALALGAVAVAGGAGGGPQDAPVKQAPLHQGGYLNSYIALLKSDLRSRKASFIAEGLRLTDKEAAVFRPVYKDYEADLKRLDDARLLLVKDFSDNSDNMTGEKASALIERRFELEGRRVVLERTYFRRLAKVLPAKTVARFFQLEYRFSLMMDLKSASEVPLIEQ